MVVLLLSTLICFSTILWVVNKEKVIYIFDFEAAVFDEHKLKRPKIQKKKKEKRLVLRTA